MTRTNKVALDGPHAAGAAPLRKGSPRAARRLLVLPLVLLAMAFVFPGGALAASTGEAGYGTTAPTPKTTTTTPKTTPTTEKTPASGTSPSKEASTPSSGVSPAKESSTTPTKTLPFTGFDLRWTVGIGLLLVAMGFSIVTVQRRQRRDGGS